MAYEVDIVMCIDSTGSMSHILDTVKKHALGLHSDLLKALSKHQKIVDKLRVKVIYFKDIFCDDPAFFISDFFMLPEQEDEFNKFVHTMTAGGGGDEPESGLDALDKAIESDWNPSAKRSIIALWTDASAHPLENGSGSGVSKNINELTNKWGQNMKLSSKRLLIFAPNVYPWQEITESWDAVIHYESQAGEGLNEMNYDEILNVLVKSIS